VKRHKEVVEGWEGECNRLWVQGVRDKDLPKEPKHPLKSKLLEEEQEAKKEWSMSSLSEDEK